MKSGIETVLTVLHGWHFHYTFYHCICGMPPIYMVVLSFAAVRGFRVTWGNLHWTITEIFWACISEHICGITETGIYQYNGDRFDQFIRSGYFMAELPKPQRKRKSTALLSHRSGKFPDPFGMAGLFCRKRTFELLY